MKEFAGKVVLVTGSVRNTGLEIARLFLEEGATVYINGRTPEKVREALAELAPAAAGGGGTARDGTADVSDGRAVRELFGRIVSETARLDVLVNNAVVQGVGGPIQETDDELLEQVLRTNLCGYFYCARAAAQVMIPQKSGAIVNLSSNTSQRAIRNRSVYVMTKGGIDAFTRALTVDLGSYGIRVNTVAPGYIHTDRWEVLEPETAATRRQNIPIGKEASGRDIANAVLFMASEKRAANVSGARLVVDGGCSAQHMSPGVDC